MKKLWSPDQAFVDESNMKTFMDWINNKHKLELNDYKSLWNWSIQEQNDFWRDIVEYFQIDFSGSINTVCDQQKGMIGTQWFNGIQVNYAEHVFKNKQKGIAIEFLNESGIKKSISWTELESETARIAGYYKSKGLGVGSKIVAFLPNIPEAIIAFLACNSIGAIWSSCSPDFGIKSVLDRFSQIEPDLLLVANGYEYNGKTYDKTAANEQLIESLSSLTTVISIDYSVNASSFEHSKSINWNKISKNHKELAFTRVPFNDPIWVLYSSGTTGLPKAITHSVGGIIIEHVKAISLHQNVKEEEVFFWFSTTGWMMWNYANAALLVGGTVAIFDGSPAYPSLNCLWDFAHDAKVNHFGAGASFYSTCMKQELELKQPLQHLVSLGSTGSPLTPETFSWIYENIKQDLWLISLSGGTDICSGFVGGNPFDPVFEGEIQCRMLGVNLHAYSESGEAVVDELGEMVIENVMPSMPIYFWNDKNNQRYHSSYFEMYPNKWRHGDWIKINKSGSVIIFGRSDSTLNRGGVRIGTSEIYIATETLPEIKDSIVICIDHENGTQNMLLFVVLNSTERKLDRVLKAKINQQLMNQYSPRHVPNSIHTISEVPYTISGKKMEAAVKKILSGKSIVGNVATDSMKNPHSLSFFEQFYKDL